MRDLHLEILICPGLGAGLFLWCWYSHPVGSLPQGCGRNPVNLGGARQTELLGPESLQGQAHVSLGVGFIALLSEAGKRYEIVRSSWSRLVRGEERLAGGALFQQILNSSCQSD